MTFSTGTTPKLAHPSQKAVVNAYKAQLAATGLSASTINVRLSAVRKLVSEAADNGVINPDLAASIGRVKGARRHGVRIGNWLDRRQAEQLMNAPDATTMAGKRDRALLAILIGCGLRRSEAAALTFTHIQQRENRWVIVDLVGKRVTLMRRWLGREGRLRSSVHRAGWRSALSARGGCILERRLIDTAFPRGVSIRSASQP